MTIYAKLFVLTIIKMIEVIDSWDSSIETNDTANLDVMDDINLKGMPDKIVTCETKKA